MWLKILGFRAQFGGGHQPEQQRDEQDPGGPVAGAGLGGEEGLEEDRQEAEEGARRDVPQLQVQAQAAHLQR